MTFNAANQDVNRVPKKPASTQRGFAVVQGHSAGRPARQSEGHGACAAAGLPPHFSLDPTEPRGREGKKPWEKGPKALPWRRGTLTARHLASRQRHRWGHHGATAEGPAPWHGPGLRGLAGAPLRSEQIWVNSPGFCDAPPTSSSSAPSWQGHSVKKLH